jgi:hypothetical protein
MASSVAVSQACSAVTMSIRAGSAGDSMASSTRRPEEGHARESRAAGQAARALDEFLARLDAVDVATSRCLEEQVVEDEAEVGFARAVIGQGQAACPACRVRRAAAR